MLFCITANYMPKALTAMRENPSTNRREAVEQMVVAAGGKVVSMYATIAEGPGALLIIDVDPLAAPAITSVITSSEAVHNVRMMRLFTQDEVVTIRQTAKKIRGSYKVPGQ